MVNTMHLPELKTEESNDNQGVFAVEPLHPGFGVTVGNSLRRVLLSSLSGAAVTAFKIDGVSHEFSTIPGVKEDAVQILLNIKRLRFKVFSDQPQRLTLKKSGKGKVTAGDIESVADVEVVNPKQHIATLDNSKSKLAIEFIVERGRGYVPVEDRTEELEVGMIAVDALFSPVKRVRYRVENTRVGQMTNLDKLVIDIETDGTIAPADALAKSAQILVEQFSVISGDVTPEFSFGSTESVREEGEGELDLSIEDLALSPRTSNALVNNNIQTVRDLVTLSEEELGELKGFGAKAREEVNAKLKELELK